MKKIILTSVLLTLISTTLTFGQTKVNSDNIPNVIFCNAAHENDTIKYSDLVKCIEITQPYKELKIKSFTVSFLFPPADGKGESLFLDYSNTGGKLSEQILDVFKTLEAKKVKKIIIEQVTVLDVDGKTERKMKGTVINLM
ncbi:MAG: hypothetical protein Q8L90_12250 [Bacteroidota bacterium]|nr:hypothetical protein [Bacteroidota bacterium]